MVDTDTGVGQDDEVWTWETEDDKVEAQGDCGADPDEAEVELGPGVCTGAGLDTSGMFNTEEAALGPEFECVEVGSWWRAKSLRDPDANVQDDWEIETATAPEATVGPGVDAAAEVEAGAAETMDAGASADEVVDRESP